MATINTGDDNFGVAKWIVDSSAGYGTHTTIGAALTSASSGDTIFIRPGTYTQDLTLKAGVDLVAFEADALTPNVTIVGNCTLSTVGTVSISGIRLQTNSAAFLTVSGSVASIVNLTNCYLNCSNATGISFTSSSGSSQINITNCRGDLGTTGIGLFAMSASGAINFRSSTFTNSGGSSTANTISAGTFDSLWTTFSNPLTSSGTATAAVNTGSNINTSAQNVTAFTSGGSGSHRAGFSIFASGTASAISVSNTLGCNLITIDSTNTNAITGGGTVVYCGVSFSSTGNLINTTTQAARYMNLGQYRASFQPCFEAYPSATLTNVTGDATNYTVIFNTAVFDNSSNYNTGTGVFTAPVAGKYLFVANLQLAGLTASFTSSNLSFNQTTVGTVFASQINPGACRDSNNSIIINSSYIANLAASDTISCVLTVSGSTKTVSIPGGFGFTRFSGFLIC